MGADLYRKSISDAAEKKWDPVLHEAAKNRDERIQRLISSGRTEVQARNEGMVKKYQKQVDEAYDNMHPEDGYFRDSYNVSSVLNRMDLSWWGNVVPMQDKNGCLSPKKLLQLVDMIEKAELKPLTQEEYEANFGKEDTLESWNEYFQKKRDRLVKFLRTAALAGEKIHASL